MHARLASSSIALSLLVACDALPPEGENDRAVSEPAETETAADSSALSLPDDVQLPTSKISQRLEPAAKASPVVSIGTSSLRLDGEMIATVEHGALGPDVVKGHLIGDLFDALQAAEKGGTSVETLDVAADETTPYGLVVDTWYTAGRAESKFWGIVVRREDGGLGVLRVHPPEFRPVEDEATRKLGTKIEIGVSGHGFRTEGTRHLVPARDPDAALNDAERWDHEGLVSMVQAHLEAQPGPIELTISASPEIPVGAIIGTLDGVLGQSCGDGIGAAGCPVSKLIVEAGTQMVDENLPVAATETQTQTTKVAGALDTRVVERIVHAHINEVRACYAKHGSLGNTELTASFTIGAEGTVDASTTGAADEKLEPLAACVDGAVMRWKFPKSKDGQPVSASMTFASNDEGTAVAVR